MGCTSSTLDPTQTALSAALDRQAQLDQARDRAVIKMLILGAGESGKSTLIKQMTSIYGQGFPESERIKARKDIHNNVIESMRTLVKQAGIMETTHGTSVYGAGDAKAFFGALTDEDLVVIDAGVAKFIEELWKDKGIQIAYGNRHLFQLPDSAAYYFNRITAIGADDYIPTEDDVLRTRVRTTGVVQYNFTINGNNFIVVDVGLFF